MNSRASEMGSPITGKFMNSEHKEKILCRPQKENKHNQQRDKYFSCIRIFLVYEGTETLQHEKLYQKSSLRLCSRCREMNTAKEQIDRKRL
jgi:hypothetical protein